LLEKTEFKGWPNCYRLYNDLMDLIVTTDVGPRIIRFGFVDEHNEFKVFEHQAGKIGEDTFEVSDDGWCIWGGHRLWVAPETREGTYYPDIDPVQLEEHDAFIRLIQPVEKTTGIQKEIDISLSPDAPHVQLVQRLRNTNQEPVTLAPWGLNVMAPGGVGIVPIIRRIERSDEFRPPTNTIALWDYTDMSDPRWSWGKNYVMAHQDPAHASAQKIGVWAPDGWAAYARAGHLFVARAAHQPDALYPDANSSIEVFFNDEFLEIETLGPLVTLESGAVVEHVEHWFLFRDVPEPASEADVDEHVLPIIAQTQI